jgi:Lrp/AsnC family transcriptional regulator, leucine-responsive regulatory protein
MAADNALDILDCKILSLLSSDARIPYAKLGRKVGLSASAVAERVKRMESEGIILGYHARLDEKALGYAVVAFVRMTCDNTHYRAFLKALPRLEAVQECYHITGGDAFLVKVKLGSLDELETLIEQLLPFGMPTTSMVLSTPIPQQPPKVLRK